MRRAFCSTWPARLLYQRAKFQPAGTLLLDQKPNLPAGRVRVVVQPLPVAAATEDWWQYLQRTRRQLEAINYPTMTAAEVESHVEWLRGDEDRIEEVYREIEE